MRTLISICLALVLALPLLAWTQYGSQQSGSQSQSSSQNQPSAQSQSTTSQSGTQSQGNKEMTGTVSKDGTTFTSDKDNKSYKVDNPDALKGKEGQQVTVVVAVDPNTGNVRIIQVAAPAPPQP